MHKWWEQDNGTTPRADRMAWRFRGAELLLQAGARKQLRKARSPALALASGPGQHPTPTCPRAERQWLP